MGVVSGGFPRDAVRFEGEAQGRKSMRPIVVQGNQAR